MTDEIIDSAVPHPHDEGISNISDGEEDWGSAGLQMLHNMAQQANVSYVLSDSVARFTSHDGTNDEVDITGGTVFLDMDDNEAGDTYVQTTLGGTTAPAYDVRLDEEGMLCVTWDDNITNVSLDSGTLNDIYICYATDSSESVPSPGDAYVRSGSSVSAPTNHPSVLIGRVNPDDSSQDEYHNRYPPGMFQVGVFEQLSSTPDDSYLFNTDQSELYFKDDGNLYKRPFGGPEEQVGSGGTSTSTGLPSGHRTLGDALDATNGSSSNPSDVAAAFEYGLKNYEKLYISQSYTMGQAIISSGVGSVEVGGEGSLNADSGIGNGNRFIQIENADRLTINNLSINGNYSSHSNTSRLFEVTNCRRVNIENCLFRNSGDPAGGNGQPHTVNLIGGETINFRWNQVTSTGGKGINAYANSGSGHDDPLFYNIIGNEVTNTAEECIFTGDEVSSTTTSGETTFTVQWNYMKNNGIQNLFRAAGNSVHDLYLVGNEFAQPNDFSAINLKPGGGTGIDAETVEMHVSNNVIRQLSGNASNAVAVQGTGGGHPSGSFTSNVVYGSFNCVWSSDPQYWLIMGNKMPSGKLDIQDGNVYTIAFNFADIDHASGISDKNVVYNWGTVNEV
jgi:hypothetical protein